MSNSPAAESPKTSPRMARGPVSPSSARRAIGTPLAGLDEAATTCRPPPISARSGKHGGASVKASPLCISSEASRGEPSGRTTGALGPSISPAAVRRGEPGHHRSLSAEAAAGVPRAKSLESAAEAGASSSQQPAGHASAAAAASAFPDAMEQALHKWVGVFATHHQKRTGQPPTMEDALNAVKASFAAGTRTYAPTAGTPASDRGPGK